MQSAHKPLVRYARRSGREQEHQAFRDEAQAIERRIAEVAAGREPIVVGPWLAEVGYEVLYWIPFLRWFQDAHGVARERLIVVSRGGLDELYRPLAGGYVDLFDLATPQELAARNAERRAAHEGGGQKQSGAGPFDIELAQRARTAVGAAAGPLLHPSLLFGLFRNVWYGNLPMDVLWRHVRHEMHQRPGAAHHPGPARRLHRRQAVRRPGALHLGAVGGRRPCAGGSRCAWRSGGGARLRRGARRAP